MAMNGQSPSGLAGSASSPLRGAPFFAGEAMTGGTLLVCRLVYPPGGGAPATYLPGGVTPAPYNRAVTDMRLGGVLTPPRPCSVSARKKAIEP